MTGTHAGAGRKPHPRRIAIVGAGWAGLATAVAACQRGHQVSVFEASRQLGGRARRLVLPWPDALPRPPGPTPNALVLDNGQHILIGGYSATLQLMQQVGVALPQVLQALPLTLRFPDGAGLACPTWARRWPAPLDTLASMATAQGWQWSERWAFLSTATRWRLQGFRCASHLSVHALCAHLPQRVLRELIEPLCVAALNTPAERASASVFLRVLQDALLGTGHGPWRSADLLLPSADLGRLLPDAAQAWLTARGARLHLGARVTGLQAHANGRWGLHVAPPHSCASETEPSSYDDVVLACPPRLAVPWLQAGPNTGPDAAAVQAWCSAAQGLAHEAIGTVYAWTPSAAGRLPCPMLALRCAPAQFVFDRSQLGGPPGVLAFVASAWQGSAQALEHAVLQQAQTELGLQGLRPLATVVEKHATFACTPGLLRPGMAVAPGLWAAGDAIAGPYPATLEGAVRSGLQVVHALEEADARPA